MASLSYDGQSFIVDGRRTWLVSGSIHYARVPSELWLDRIRAARQAGLNCIDTYVFWNLHEPEPGAFTFTGDADLRRFIQLVGQENMYCILRPGPFIGAEWDNGGLPAWLDRYEGLQLRQANPQFLEFTARYLGKLMDQVRDLQITPAGVGTATGRAGGLGDGPLLMMQVEHEWFCHNSEQAEAYLFQLVRYLRENGCTVPISVCNNLWQRVEGTVHTWNVNEHLAADLRQLQVVQPEAPPLVAELWTGSYDCWGEPHKPRLDADDLSYRLGQVLAAGGQFNLYMFHGGTNFGFWGGRAVTAPACYVTTSYDYDAPLGESGERGDKYFAIKRICTFASQFSHVLAHLNTASPHVAVAPQNDEHSISVFHHQGSQGSVVYLLRSRKDKSRTVQLLLPNGRVLDVPLGDNRFAWLVLDANLGGIAELTYTNLRPWAFLQRQMLVVFGPAGSQGVVCINGSPYDVTVPKDQTPWVEQHEELTLVVLNEQQIDTAYATATGLVVGAASLDVHSQPTPAPGWKLTQISLAGSVQKTSVKPPVRSKPPSIESWECSQLTSLVDGSSDAFKPIDGPASLSRLRWNYSYGWYRLQLDSAINDKVLPGRSSDRLHLYNAAGKLTTVFGAGPGADAAPVALKLAGSATVLADNLGRFSMGYRLGEPRGWIDHLYAVKPMALKAPRTVTQPSLDPFTLSGFWLFQRRGDPLPEQALSWSFKVAAAESIILDVRDVDARCMIIVNDTLIDIYDPQLSAGRLRCLLHVNQQLQAGTNELRLAFWPDLDIKPNLKGLQLYLATPLTAGAQWSFAPWQPPPADSFKPVPKAASPQPCWFRTHFEYSGAQPLWCEPVGLSKGQLLLNGHNVGRYFQATAQGKTVGPQQRYLLPLPWLKPDGVNELLLFDEHGRLPSQCRLVHADRAF